MADPVDVLWDEILPLQAGEVRGLVDGITLTVIGEFSVVEPGKLWGLTYMRRVSYFSGARIQVARLVVDESQFRGFIRWYVYRGAGLELRQPGSHSLLWTLRAYPNFSGALHHSLFDNVQARGKVGV